MDEYQGTAVVFDLCQIALIILKLTGILTWSWWIILTPTIFLTASVVLLLILCIIIALVVRAIR